MALSISAAPVTFHSGPSDGGNDRSPGNIVIAPRGVWATEPGSQWISFMDTGVGGVTLPDDFINPFASFWVNFTLPSSLHHTGTINVWADDTADVYLNNLLIGSAAPALGANCASTAPSCIKILGGRYTVTNPLLHSGVNTLRIDVYQRGGDVAGVLYSGSVDSTAPEPATYAMMTLGLAALGLISRRRR